MKSGSKVQNRKTNRAVIVGLIIGLAGPIISLIVLATFVFTRTTRSALTPVSAASSPVGTPLPTREAQVATETSTAPAAVTLAVDSASSTPTTIALTLAVVATAPDAPATSTLPPSTPRPTNAAVTATPTFQSTLEATPSPNAQFTATNTAEPTDGPTPTPTATAASAWRFINLTISVDPLDSRHSLVYGEVLNASGVAQEITDFTGTFFNGQGQSVAGTESVRPYWPLAVLPAGGQMPFELQVLNTTGLARADLGVLATPREEAPRTDFNFENVSQSINGEFYCVRGQLRNPGGALTDYLVIAVLLYDAQNNVVKFADESDGPPIFAVGERLKSFEICIAPPYPGVVRYELRAWGR